MEQELSKTLTFLDFGIFAGSVCFSSGYTFDELREVLKKKRQSHWLAAMDFSKDSFSKWSTISQTIDDDGVEYTYYFLFCLDPFDFSDLSMCYLAHECLHLCQFHLRHMLSRDREYECEAYTHTHLMKQCLAAMRLKKSTTKKPRLEGESDRFIAG